MKRKWLAVVGGVVAVVLAVGLALFQPWHLWQDSYIDEAVPTPTGAASSDGAPGSANTQGAEKSAPEEPTVLAMGDFVDGEHHAEGVAKVLELSDGSRFVRLENLVTSEGPDVHIWLTDQPSGGSWGSYDDGRYVRLGELKADHGNQNYRIPADADITGMRSVVIWCDAFNVAFGTAPVEL